MILENKLLEEINHKIFEMEKKNSRRFLGDFSNRFIGSSRNLIEFYEIFIILLDF